MRTDLYLSFIAYACAATFLPGPNNILMFSQASRHGARRVFPLLTGIWTGLLTVMLLAGTFSSVLGTLVPKITPVFRFVGAAYILYLAWKTFRARPVSTQGREDVPLRFANGFLLQFLNIKVIMLGLAAYPVYFLPMGAGLGFVLLFAVTMTACCGTGNLIWTFLGSVLCPLYNRHCRIVNTVMALLLVWCALKVLR